MNERMQESLHRWLPRIAVASMVVSVGSFLFVEYHVVPRRDTESELRLEEQHLYKEALETRTVDTRAALERISGLIETLDGNRQIQEALSEAVALEESIAEVWVTNAQGLIVYYGRHSPPLLNVAEYALLGPLPRLLDTVPEDLLEPMQRTAILLPAVIGAYWDRMSSLDADTLSKLAHSTQSWSTVHLLWLAPPQVEMRRLRDGLIAAVVSQPASADRYGRSWERTEELRLIGNLTTLAIAAGLIAFWITIPSWMLLDARRRGERAAAWGLFGLLGNVMALVIYLLVRRDPQEETA